MSLLYGILWGVLAQATVFLQLQGSLKLCLAVVLIQIFWK